MDLINYYDLFDYVSNSTLTAFYMLMNGLKFGDNMQPIFDFGNLIDGMLTEPEKLDFLNKTMIKEHGEIVQFSDSDWQRALNMRESGRKNTMLKMMIESFETQKIVIKEKFPISGDGFNFYLPFRCKYDFVKFDWRIGGDLKSTACTTHKTFIASLYALNYDRQGSLYMDLGDLDKFVFVGICKTPNKKGIHEVFTHAIERGDLMYESGKSKYQMLATQYYFLIQ